jgi:MFS family permease
VLAVAQALGMAAGPLVTLAGGIVGQALAPSPLLATLPITSLIVGVATCSVPAALLMGRVGRRAGFMIGAAIGMTGALGAVLATDAGSFAGFCGATFGMGAGAAFVQQYRFAAAESVDPRHTGRAVSFVLIGGLVAGAIGPEIGRRGRLWLDVEFSGAFLAIAIVQAVVIVLLALLYAPAAVTAPAVDRRIRVHHHAIVLLRRPAFGLALAAGATAYGVMSFIMTATPISMHVMDGHSLDDTTLVIQSHVMAMYAPSLVTGFLVDRLGVRRMMAAGAFALLGCIANTAFNHSFGGYWTGLVLLGVGWNLLFVGGTVLLTRSYQPSERFRAQATNDLAVFGSQASASLASGAALHRFGWMTMNLAAVPVLAAMLTLIALVGSRALPPAVPAKPEPPGVEPPV